MKIKPLIAAIALTGFTNISVAAETPVEQKRGAVAGLIVGVAAGGPIGAFAGTVMGAEVFGRLFEQKRVLREQDASISHLQARLVIEKNANATLVADLNQDLDKVLALQSSSAKSQRLPVQFRTGSSDVESQYAAELENIARVLRRNQDARVSLTGYADRRGETANNQVLSEDRVTAVERFLLNHGASRSQILSMAFGESQPLEFAESLENNFFDRRVLIELNMDIDPQLATR
ncbi:MAG: OmpA family protein [Gammaproteobacteria bacterium]|jgi:sortase system peptidoglycan-associated protein|nr:OmpA family protein [Gammaproteobacteria bacterium]MBT4494413.1 OmpA family protein [Gammaproteobacteria bacterium]MBT7369987.1 OmpA family protein [Gammaproteobacteria bacterium]